MIDHNMMPDEQEFLRIMRKANVDAEVVVIRRDGRIVQVKVTDTYVKEFKPENLKLREGG